MTNHEVVYYPFEAYNNPFRHPKGISWIDTIYKLDGNFYSIWPNYNKETKEMEYYVTVDDIENIYSNNKGYIL